MLPLPQPKVSLRNFTAAYFTDWWKYISDLATQASTAIGAKPGILWNPDGGGTATTFAQVLAQVAACPVAQPIQLVGNTATPYAVPAGPVSGYDLKNCWFQLPQITGPGAANVILADGAVLRNMGAPLNGAAVQGNSTSLPALVFDVVSPGFPEFMAIGFQGALSNKSPNNTPLWRPTASLAVLISEGGILDPGSTAPIVEIGAGNGLIVGVRGGFGAPDGFAVGAAGAVLWDSDGSAPSPFPALPGVGSVSTQGLVGQSCADAASRPVAVFQALPVGLMVWQQDIGQLIVWDGAAWQSPQYAGVTPYTPANPADWNGVPPASTADALDRIAAAFGPIP